MADCGDELLAQFGCSLQFQPFVFQFLTAFKPLVVGLAVQAVVQEHHREDHHHRDRVAGKRRAHLIQSGRGVRPGPALPSGKRQAPQQGHHHHQPKQARTAADGVEGNERNQGVPSQAGRENTPRHPPGIGHLCQSGNHTDVNRHRHGHAIAESRQQKHQHNGKRHGHRNPVAVRRDHRQQQHGDDHDDHQTKQVGHPAFAKTLRQVGRDALQQIVKWDQLHGITCAEDGHAKRDSCATNCTSSSGL